MSSLDDVGTETVEEATPFIGLLDIFVLSACLGLGIYWFFFKGRKKEESINIKNFNIAAPMMKAADSCFIQKMKSTNKNIVIFYGSQTGTAEEFAGRLAKDSQRYGMKALLQDPEESEMEDLTRLKEIDNSFAIFCMATYGEGDPTDNAQEFYDWLQEGSPDLQGLKFAVFGLGNKTYEHYNEMGKFVDKKLEELGGERLFEPGLGDDDGNMEEDFVTWKDKFWPSVCEHFGVEATGDESSIRQYSVTVHEDIPDEKIYTGEPARLHSLQKQKGPFDAKNPFVCKVQINRELHKGGERSCMHIEFDITDSKIRYESGDHVAVYPMNNLGLVDGIGKILNQDLDVLFSLNNVDEDASKKHPFPCPCTYRTALSFYLDITNCPRTNVLKDISEYCSDEKDKEFLLKMSSATPEGKKEYSDWVVKSHRNILAILEDLPSCKPPLDHLCELLPRLQARYYSISSSPKLHPSSIHITAVLVEYTTPTNRTNLGVATSWLKDKIPNGPENVPKVPIYVRKSQFRLPFKHTTPVIMVGPGTGLAPFRGFIQERSASKQDGKEVGETVLFFGCRKEAEDFIYQDELSEYVDNGTLTHMYVAFSRDQAQKRYVQDIMKEQADKIWELLEKGAHIYVCGDARNMAPDVQKTIREIISEKGGLASGAADDYLKKMQSKGRYSCDVWS
ncbi:NADPH--cytochrome P450 reductase-like [Anneissia japonica]|uniref:NADPH--cytochrome P450 reductase-like n=1 Tax=Anneissia japonica TaxID=1529436 RepID=UPI00142565C5|nr:NADPH--cytochrome P450 reductase-like [Anneissia japonica]